MILRRRSIAGRLLFLDNRRRMPAAPSPLSSDSTDGPPDDPFDLSYERWIPSAVAASSHYFDSSDGLRLHYTRWGANDHAPVLAMIHGRRAHGRWFDPVVPPFVERYDCVALDIRGHGDSPAKGGVDFNRYAADVHEFLNLFRGRKIALLAHSMAGRVVLRAHELFGMVPTALILADTPLMRRPHHFKPEPDFINKPYPDRDAIMRRFRLMPPGNAANPELLQHIAGHSIRQNADGSWQWKFDDKGTNRPVGFSMPDFMEINVEGLTCPTLVIHGDQSMLVGVPEAEAIASRFSNARTVTLTGAYHHLMFDRPSDFNRAVDDFLEPIMLRA